MRQQTFFDFEENKKPKTIEERFEVFHLENPHIFEGLKEISLSIKRSGRSRYGVKALFERLRWDYSTTTTGKDFKLSNDFTALYARKLMEEVPDLKNFFQTKKRKSKRG